MAGQGRKRGPLAKKIGATAGVACFLLFVVVASRALAATTVHVKIGGTFFGPPLAPGGVVWFNGFDPATILIHPGDTITWDLVGGAHTVTSSDTFSNGTFKFDSSPLFTPAGALADMGAGKLLHPGAVYDLDTTGMAPGTYPYGCKIHAGMAGNLTITIGGPNPRIVNVVAGWGDHE
ncbi:MAG: hypothetical protein L3J78_02560, partial [Thermoplasmata archaeon]|nr:hypothetical protein [Thermoplasmata archaeon]